MDKTIQIGQPAPEFEACDQNGNAVSLKDFAPFWLVLYFYPKDNTPGCTTEAKDFSAYAPEFEKLGARVVGVSPDSEKSHCNFIAKHDLSIQLLSDREHKIAEAYGVWGLKKFMGKEYMGIIRSTFIIGTDRTIVNVWRNVRVKTHVEEVLEKLKGIRGTNIK
jgi:thioredoxin-dependent peroxiredoxin